MKRIWIAAGAAAALSFATPASAAFIGEVLVTAGTYCPEGTLALKGQTLPVQEYQALYSVIGDQFGGDRHRTFNLPKIADQAVPGGHGKLIHCIWVHADYPPRDDH